MIDYTWQIDTIECFPTLADRTDVVNRVCWTLIATDGKIVEPYHGSVNLEINLDSKDFISYDMLTSEEVIRWVISNLGEDFVTSLQEQLAQVIAKKTTPQTIKKSLPWASVSEPGV